MKSGQVRKAAKADNKSIDHFTRRQKRARALLRPSTMRGQ